MKNACNCLAIVLFVIVVLRYSRSQQGPVLGLLRSIYPETTGIEEGVWRRAILALIGWRSQIERDEREWLCPYSLSPNDTKVAIVSDISLADKTDDS